MNLLKKLAKQFAAMQDDKDPEVGDRMHRDNKWGTVIKITSTQMSVKWDKGVTSLYDTAGKYAPGLIYRGHLKDGTPYFDLID